MAKKRTYKAGNEVYEIPDNELKDFQKDFPNAVEIESFTVEGDTFDIPLDEVDDFVSEFPKAVPLKKKRFSPSFSRGYRRITFRW